MCARHIAPLVSVVITGKDSKQHLLESIHSIRSIKGIGGTIEVLYLDFGSKDNSPAAARNLDVHVIGLGKISLASAHNTGWRTSRGEYILFLDRIGKIEPEALKQAVQLFEDKEVGAVCGTREGREPCSYIACSQEDVILRRSALDEIGGFDKTLLAGDLPDVCRRMRAHRYKVEHLGISLTTSNAPILSCWERLVERGIAYAQVSSRFAASTDPLWLSESRYNLIEGGFLLAGLPLLILLSMLIGSWIPAVCGLVGFFGLIVSAAMQNKGTSVLNRIVSGFKHTLAQFPIFIGQLKYRFFCS